jgi:predicted MFS family arabinose efflux permease
MMWVNTPSIPFFKSIWLAAFCGMCGLRICDAMLPSLVTEFNSNTVAVAACISGFAIAYGLMQFVYGPLADHFGKPRVIAWVSVGCVCGMALASVAPTLQMLVGARIMTGIAAAGIIPIALAYVGDTSTNENRQESLAKFASAIILGGMAGQLLGGLASDTIGWRWAFALLGVMFVLAAWNLRTAFGAPKTFVAESTNQSTKPSVTQSLLAGFAKYQELIKTTGVPVFLTLAFFQGMINSSAMSFIPTIVHDHFSVSLTQASLVVVGYALGSLAYSRTASHFLKKYTAARIALIGGLIQASSFVCLILVPAWSIALLVGLIGGFGTIMLHNNLQTQATRMVPGLSGTSVASFAMMLFFGQAIGVSFIAASLEKYSGEIVLPAIALASSLLVVCVYWRFKVLAKVSITRSAAQ